MFTVLAIRLLLASLQTNPSPTITHTKLNGIKDIHRFEYKLFVRGRDAVCLKQTRYGRASDVDYRGQQDFIANKKLLSIRI